MTQPRPKGLHWKITPEWVAWVRERMDQLDLSQDQLAEKMVSMGAQASGSAISDLLSGKRPESRLVPYINRALGGLLPVQYPLGYEPGVDEVQARIRDKLKALPDAQRRLVLDLIEQLARKR